MSIPVEREHLQHYVPDLGWCFDGGPVGVHIGSSSRDIRLHAEVELPGEPISRPLTAWSTFGEWQQHPQAGPALLDLIDHRGGVRGRMGDLLSEPSGQQAVLGAPLRTLLELAGFPADEADIERPLKEMS
ncbi:MAG: hypothetical protein IJH84_05405 [Saccharopolyspora sp.]|nr:hypothetical protein [Saccharopolyspora sp.]